MGINHFMKSKNLFFSIDRLGDYLIRSNVIKKVSENYDYNEIICSNINFKLIRNQNFFNKISIFDNNFKFFQKLKYVYHYSFKQYDSVIVFDGKNISNLLLLLLRAKFKFTFIYIKKKIINKIKFYLLTFIYKFFNIKYVVLNNRDVIESGNLDNYPQKYMMLGKYFNNIENKTYYLKRNNTSFFSKIKNTYIVIHLDEKFNDIIDINSNFNQALKSFSKNIDRKLIITSYKNNHYYYQKLDLLKKDLTSFKFSDLDDQKIVVIENLSINYFQDLLENSHCNISCHSGYFVHTSLGLNKQTIDIMNQKDMPWLQTWINQKNKYKIIFKSNHKYMISIGNILQSIKNEI